MLPRRALIVLAVSLLANQDALAQPPTGPAANAQRVGADRNQPLATVQTFMKANTSGDLDVLVSTFADDATVFFPSNPPERVSGRGNIREAFAVLLKRRTAALPPITATDVDVQIVENMAIVTAHVARPPEAAPGTSRRTFVLRRDGERWLIIHHHASNLQATAR